MADTKSMNVSEGFEGLVSIQLNQDHWHGLFVLIIVLQNSKHRFWHVVHHNVQINLIWFVALCVERMFKCDHIWMK